MEKLATFFRNLWIKHKLILSIVLSIGIFLFILSFFIDVGYLLAPIVILFIFWFANRTSNENQIDFQGEIEQENLNKELNTLLLELQEVNKNLLDNPHDFHARHKRTDLENQINNLTKKINTNF